MSSDSLHIPITSDPSSRKRTSIHNGPIGLRILAAWAENTCLGLAHPRRFANFAKSWIKFPVEYSAACKQKNIPNSTFQELFGVIDDQHTIIVDRAALNRHGWNVKLHEEIYLTAAVRALKPLRIFEIGTFDGNTTRRLAEAAPEDAKIFTLDLPEEAFDATQGPESFSGSRVGECYRGSPAVGKIQQIRADAASFDFSKYRSSMDFIFVDAAHDYPHGLSDTRNALEMVRPGGTIIWHDFEPYWSGLVQAICDATAGLPLKRLGGTSFAVLRVPPANS